MTQMTEKEKKETQREANVLQMLDHQNIIKYQEHYKTKKGRLHIVMDYAEGKYSFILITNHNMKESMF